MLDPNGRIFTLRGYLFKYEGSALHICTDGTWNKYEGYPTYEEAFNHAEEIVDEYFAMCGPSL